MNFQAVFQFMSLIQILHERQFGDQFYSACVDRNIAERSCKSICAADGHSSETDPVGRSDENHAINNILALEQSGIRGCGNRTGIDVTRMRNNNGFGNFVCSLGIVKELINHILQLFRVSRIESSCNCGISYFVHGCLPPAFFILIIT